MYKNITAIETAEEFDATKWQKTSLKEMIDVQAKKTKDSSWINIVPTEGTAATGARYIPQYRKNGNRVEMRGYISDIGAEGTIVFTLPEGYRPTNRIRVLCVGDNLDSMMSILRILENGDVYMHKTNSTTGYLNLDCVSFLVD